MKASHQYIADDTDELSFEPGEIISVIPFDDNDEQVSNLQFSMKLMLLLL